MKKSYRSFAEYLNDRFYNEFASRIKNYIIRNRQSLCSEFDAFYVEFDDFRIRGVRYRGVPRDYAIRFYASIEVFINCKRKGRRDIEENGYSIWLSASCSATLLDGLHNFRILDVERYHKDQTLYEDSLSQCLVPYINSEDLDEAAEDFLSRFYPDALERPIPVDVEAILKNMKLQAFQAPLPENIFGKSYFTEADIKVFREGCRSTQVIHAAKGTVLINPDVYFMRNLGSEHNTIIHECVHQDQHGLFFELQRLLRGNEDFEAFSCEVWQLPGKADDELSEALRWIEWQACALTPRIQMPKETATRKFLEIHAKKQQEFPGERAAVMMEEAVDEFSKFFHVTRTCAKIRLCQMGFTQALGTFNYGIDEYKEPYSFNPEALKKGETFSLNERDYHFLFVTNPEFRQLVLDELFIYTENFFCIKDDQYVRVDEHGIYHLTDYARDHVDECCLVFQAKTKYQAKEYDDSFFTECFLCREVDASLFVEEEFYDEGDNQDRIEKAEQCQKIKKQAKAIADSADILPGSFGKTLAYHMERKCISPLELEELSGISEETILQYLDKTNDRPGKTSVLALCVGLNLQPIYSIDMLRKTENDLFSKMSVENTCYIDLVFNHPMETREQWNEKCKIWGIPVLPTRNR